MKTKRLEHLQGPWEYVESDNGFYIEDVKNKATIAEIFLCAGFEKGNRDLILAAPELLRAAKRALMRITALGGATKKELDETANILRTAIAKAEGR